MNIEALLQAIRTIWDELPEQVGDEWAAFEQEINSYFEQLAARAEEKSIVQAWILMLFQKHPQAHRRLVAQLQAGPESCYSKGPITRGAPPILDRLIQGAAPTTVMRYTDITCPRRVWVQAPRISVIVRLTVQRPTDSAAVAELALQKEIPVQVRVQAPAFEPLNAAEQETPILHDADSPPLVFDLRPRATGHTQIILDFYQKGNPAGTVSLPIEVTAEDVAATAEARQGRTLAIDPQVPPPDLVLHIAWQESPPALTFTLIREGGAWWRTFEPKNLSGDPSTYMGHLYEQLTALVHLTDPTGQTVLGQRRGLSPDDADRQVRQLGQNLWRELIPNGLQEIYAAERENWRDRTLLILSDEPHVPWELTWPYDPGKWADDGPWCQILLLTRWLRRDERGNGSAGAPGQLCLHNLACLVPGDSGLAAAQRERAFLADLIRQHSMSDASPPAATWKAALDLLEGGGYDWLHVAAHGNFYATSPDTDSALWLEGTRALTPQAIVGEAEGYIGTQRPAFFFNACEVGRQGWGLTRIGGWANRLISAGAGLFVAPLWSVSDGPALAFARAFYERLLAGATVAEAVRAGRLAARAEGDPTWLAYSVYAHPNARVTVR